MQMIFQDPFASLNPRMRVDEIVAEPLAIHEPELAASERRAKARELLRRVGLDDSLLRRTPAPGTAAGIQAYLHLHLA